MRRFLILTCALLLLGLSAPRAQEKAVLTTPIISSSTVADYQILSIFAQRQVMGYDWICTIRYLDSQGNEFSDQHVGLPAKPLVLAVDSATRTKTVNRLALEHLIGEGKIKASAITGTPIKE